MESMYLAANNPLKRETGLLRPPEYQSLGKVAKNQPLVATGC